MANKRRGSGGPPGGPPPKTKVGEGGAVTSGQFWGILAVDPAADAQPIREPQPPIITPADHSSTKQTNHRHRHRHPTHGQGSGVAKEGFLLIP